MPSRYRPVEVPEPALRGLALTLAAVGALLLITPGATAAAAGRDDLEACAAIGAPDSRLACYDALAHRPADPPRPKTAVPTPTVPTPAMPPSAAAPTAAAPSPGAADAASTFGLTPAQQHLTAAGPSAIDARIARIAPNRVGPTSLVLDNGQIWSVADDDGRLSAGDPVEIKRAALGSFLMTTPSNHKYRVRRVQ